MAEPPSATGVVDTDTEVLGAKSSVPVVAEARSSLIGRSLGKFMIVERLGRGGSGEVFRAEQAQLGRSAVIKVLRGDLAPSPHRVERFLREARLASRLDHPYAAHIYAFGAEPDGVLWIAMEHVRGTTLDEVIARRGPMPPGVFAPLFERLCEVVHSAHELGVVHRDLKLANVMVIERSGQLLPKLLDFGIAKGVAGHEAPSPGVDDDRSAITGHGATIGSPPYMAPEQWQRPHEVDGRADIYALGVLAYRCLSGRPPIPGSTRAELAHAHLHVVPRPLGVGPPALDEAIRRALAKAPDQRWPRALDFSAAVRKAIGVGAGESVPFVDGMVRDVWEKSGPQPIAEAVARIAAATTTVECDDALRDLVDVSCRWLAAIALAGCRAEQVFAGVGALSHARSGTAPPEPDSPTQAPAITPAEPAPRPSQQMPASRPSQQMPARLGTAPLRGRAGTAPPEPAAVLALRERARDLARQDDANAWLALARAACEVAPAVPELPAVLAGATVLAELAGRQSRGRRGRTAGDLAADVEVIGPALAPLEPLLAYRLVVGGEDGPETWIGARQRGRPRALVWGDAVAVGEVVLLDGSGRIAVRLSPLVRAQRPLPHGDLELFLIARSGRGIARLAATPWGFEHDDEEAGRFLASISTADSSSIEEIDDERSPYPGLAAYGVEDADRFFGREREIDALANRLVRAPMVAVVGPSGVGKSSFAHAGLIARLREQYRVVTLRPGRHPSEALIAAIEREAGEPAVPRPTVVPASARRFPIDDAEVGDRLRALGERANRGVVVIVDQLEEMLTLCADAPDRERFARVLGAAASGSTAPVRIVATLRDDFASLLESIDGFRDRFEVFVLGAPSPDALRRILIEPARRAGVSLEAGLVDDIVGEIAGRAAALPLLGFTAARLWQLRDRDARIMTRSAYTALGGVAGALATYADEVFASLGKREQAIARDVFARLVAADGTRVPMARAELAAIDGGSGVVDRLIEARLMTAREAELEGSEAPSVGSDDDLIEIVHECLAERWPRLVRWRSEDAADRALLGDVRAAARRWIEQHRPVDLLWRGAALNDLSRLAERASSMTAREREFATASLAAARRRVRMRRAAVVAVMTGLVAVAVVMTYLTRVAGRNADHAERSEKSARTAAELAETRLTQQLRSAGQRELVEGRPANALAYLGEVLRRGLDDDGIRLMIGQSAWAWPLEQATRNGEQLVNNTKDGTWFALMGQDQDDVVMVDGTGTELGRIKMDGYVEYIAVDRTGERLLLFGQRSVEIAPRRSPDQRTKLFDNDPSDAIWIGCFGPAVDEVTVVHGMGEVRVYGTDGALRRKLATGVDALAESVCNPEGSRMLLTSPDHTVLVDLTTLKIGLDTHDKIVTGDWADDGTLLLSTMDGTLELHDPAGALRKRWKTPGGNHTARISPDGKRVGFGGDHELIIYGDDGVEQLKIGGWRGGVGAVVFDGDDVWTGGNDGIVRRWRKDGVQLAALMSPGGDVHEIIKTPTGIAAFATRGGRFWRGTPSQIDTGTDGDCVVDRLAVARDRPMAAVVCTEKKVTLWDFDTGKTTRIDDGRETMTVELDRRGERFATWGYDGPIKIWDKTGTLLREVPGGKELMSVGWVGDRLWTVTWKSGHPTEPDFHTELASIDPATGTRTVLPFEPRIGVMGIVEISAGTAIIIGDGGELMLVRDGALVKQVATGLSQTSGPRPLAAVAAGGTRIAVASRHGEIRVYALPGLTEVHRLDVPGTAVDSVSLDRDGTTMVTVTADRRAIAWTVATGEAITTFALGDVPIYEAYFAASPDELIVFAGDYLSRLHIPRAGGTAASLAAELACRVPFRPEGGALVPTTPCPAAKPVAPLPAPAQPPTKP